MSSNKLDTSWFDLKNYDSLKSMPIDGWISVIENRVIAYNDNLFRKRFVNTIKYRPIIDESNRLSWRVEEIAKSRGYSSNYSTGSVNSLSVYDLWLISQEVNDTKNTLMQELNEACLLRNKLNNKHEKNDFTFEPYEIVTKNAYREDMTLIHAANLSVNMFATDDQIKRDFDVWLKNYRKNINSEGNKPKHDKTKDKNTKKTYGQADFNEWVNLRVIQYIDLRILEKFENIRICQTEFAKLIFPEISEIHEKDPKENLRKAKKTAELLLKSHMHRTLFAQVLRDKLTRRES